MRKKLKIHDSPQVGEIVLVPFPNPKDNYEALAWTEVKLIKPTGKEQRGWGIIWEIEYQRERSIAANENITAYVPSGLFTKPKNTKLGTDNTVNTWHNEVVGEIHLQSQRKGK